VNLSPAAPALAVPLPNSYWVLPARLLAGEHPGGATSELTRERLSRLLEAGSAIPSIGAAVRLPLFDGGRLRGNLAGKDADYDLAVEQYNQTLVDALREVVEQLAALRSVQAQRSEVEAALGSAEEAYQLAVARYRARVGSYLQVLAAEQPVLEQRIARADLHARELDVSVGLVRALGGGMEGDRTP